MVEFRCGLVVGKFAPLHRGHQHVIDTALRRCEHVVLISYSNPEPQGCTAARREAWLAELYPQTTRLVVTNHRLNEWYEGEDRIVPADAAAADIHRQFVADLLRRVVGREVDAVFTSESYGEGFAAFLQEYFRQFDPRAGAVKHVMVDAERITVPISGRVVREDVHAARQWLDPAVYAHFVERVVCLGGESSGKSTLSAALAQEFGTVHVPEFGRELWQQRGGQLTFDDMLHIARVQVAREDQLCRLARRYLFCDTSPLTTLFYSLDQFGRAAPELEALAERDYTNTLLCAPDFDFVQDGTRRGPEFRRRQHDWYVEQLERRGIPYLTLTGDLRARVSQARACLAPFTSSGSSR